MEAFTDTFMECKRNARPFMHTRWQTEVYLSV